VTSGPPSAVPRVDLPADILDLPVERAARLVALALLREASAARTRLGDASDATALHDFRVAVRRLRTWLRAYRPALAGSVRKQDRRRLRSLARATGAARDREVRIDWLRALERAPDTEGRAALTRTRRRLEVGTPTADGALRVAIRRDMARVADRLAATLPVYVVRGRVDDPPSMTTMADATAEAVLRALRALRRRLTAAQLATGSAGADRAGIAAGAASGAAGAGDGGAGGAVGVVIDPAIAHDVRIAGKRLRYLLEPLAAFIDGAPALVRQLKSLQDLIGELHDSVVVAAGITGDAGAPGVAGAGGEPGELAGGAAASGTAGAAVLPGLTQVLAQLHAREATAFERFATTWLGGGAAPFVDQVAALAATLASRNHPAPGIQRRVLLSAVPDRAATASEVDVREGFLPGERLVERLRQVQHDGVTRWYRTVSIGVGTGRRETTDATTEAVYRAIWPLTAGRRLHLRRREVVDGGLVWVIDEFRDRNLVLASVETSAPAAPLPDWLRPCVVRDVTDDAAFGGERLAR